MMNFSPLLSAAALLLLAGAMMLPDSHAEAGKPKTVTAPGATLQKLAGGFVFTEGGASDAQGNVFFTDQPNDRIWEWTLDGKLSLFLEPCGRSNGLCVDKDGSLWACADENNQLWRIARNKETGAAGEKKVVLQSDGNSKLLNGPNDVWVSPVKGGGLFFTDPLYKRPYWKRDPAMQPKGQYVYHAQTDGSGLKAVAVDLVQPNGIVGTADGKTLYVADIGDNKTYVYDIGADGSLHNKKLFYPLGSDGMTIDSEGNIFLTGHGVTVVDKAGKLVETIPVAENWTGNICFGGRDRKTLFITASTGLYAIHTRTHGVGSQ